MKQLLSLLLACLLLGGCSRNDPAAQTSEPTQPAIAVTSALVSLYDPGSPLEVQTQGAVRVYPLPTEDVYGIRAMGDALLIFSGQDSTTLTLLTGEDLYITNRIQLDFFLDAQDSSLQIRDTELSFFDPVNRRTVVLNGNLKVVSLIATPENLVGRPILSADRNTLYYCTSAAILGWDLESGIRRTVKELSYDVQELTALPMDAAVLQCRITDGGQERTLFLSSQTGLLIGELEGRASLCTKTGRFYADFATGLYQTCLFGYVDGNPQMLAPADAAAEVSFLPENNAAVTVSPLSGGEIRLDYYDLETGLRTHALTYGAQDVPVGIANTIDGFLYLLTYDSDYGTHALYRWDPRSASLAVNDGNVYTGVYSTSKEKNAEGLDRCRAYAAEMGKRYGIEVLVGEEACAVQPWDYSFEPEYQIPVLYRELTRLDQYLAQYPDGILEKTAANFTSLRFCLVRSITGTAESGSLDSATGLQFLDGTDAYVTIAAGKYAEQALYHELFHVMETQILNDSIALDRWNSLNPVDFTYTYGSEIDIPANYQTYLSDDGRAFIDRYSMSYPREDRARVMEYAMLPGNAELFDSKIMQEKLTAICEGIREAYGLRKTEESFLWEQYLLLPITGK